MPKCSVCSEQVVFDPARQETYCESCGLVEDEVTLEAVRARADYSSSEADISLIPSTLPPIDFNILSPDGSSTRRLSKQFLASTLPPEFRRNRDIHDKLQRLVAEHGLPNHLVEKAFALLGRLTTLKQLKHSKAGGAILVLLAIAAREEGIPVFISEFGVTAKDYAKGCRAVGVIPKRGYLEPERYVERFASVFLPHNLVAQVMKEVPKLEAQSGERNPRILIGVAILIVAWRNEYRLHLSDVARKTGITEPALRRLLREQNVKNRFNHRSRVPGIDLTEIS